MKYFVTGAAGYLGSTLIRQILSEKDTAQVVAYDNLMYRQISLLDCFADSRFKFVHGDVQDQDKMLSAAKDANVIIPLAAIVGAPACDQNPYLAEQVNLYHVKTICDNKRHDQRVVYPNTNSGYGLGKGDEFCTEKTPLKPISLYGRTKCEAERIVLDVGGVSLRLATVFGCSPRQRLDLLVNDFTYRACRDKYLVLFEPHFKRNYIHVRDVAKAFLFMAKSVVCGEAFNLGLSDANISKMELADMICKYVPGVAVSVSEFSKDLDQRNYVVSNEKIEQLGWKPHYSLDFGVSELVAAYPMLRRVETAAFTNL